MHSRCLEFLRTLVCLGSKNRRSRSKIEWYVGETLKSKMGGSRGNPVLLQNFRSSATNAAVAMAQQGTGYLQSMLTPCLQLLARSTTLLSGKAAIGKDAIYIARQ